MKTWENRGQAPVLDRLNSLLRDNNRCLSPVFGEFHFECSLAKLMGDVQ